MALGATSAGAQMQQKGPEDKGGAQMQAPSGQAQEKKGEPGSKSTEKAEPKQKTTKGTQGEPRDKATKGTAEKGTEPKDRGTKGTAEKASTVFREERVVPGASCGLYAAPPMAVDPRDDRQSFGHRRMLNSPTLCGLVLWLSRLFCRSSPRNRDGFGRYWLNRRNSRGYCSEPSRQRPRQRPQPERAGRRLQARRLRRAADFATR